MESNLKITKYAAIDIGSNAMRLLIEMVVDDGETVDFNKVSLVRLPIRLGADSFVGHKLGKETIQKFVNGMNAFKLIMEIYGVKDYMAAATSAMREAKNGHKVAEQIFEETGIDIQIIDGKTEADIIFKAHFRSDHIQDHNYIYVDVGGGSTEITVLSGQKIIASQSFKNGTIRLLNQRVPDETWMKMERWVRKETKHLEHVEMIGSGGSINKIYKLMNAVYPKPILYHEFLEMKKKLSAMTYDQRIKIFKLNPDRADVIVPAFEIYYSVMKWADCSILHVPKIGLSDGIIQLLYEKNEKNDGY